MPWVMQIRTACSIGPWPVPSQCWLWLSTHHVDHSTSSIWQNQWELNSNMPNERFLSSTQDILWKLKIPKPFGSVQFSHSVVFNSLQPHESQHTWPPCPSSTRRVHWNSRPSSRWCHPAITSSVVPFSSCPLPASVFSNESTLRMRWPKYWSFSFSIIPSKEHPGLISFKMDWLDLLAVQGTLKSLL